MLELRWPYKRHAETFAGTQRYALEQGWESILDEFVSKTLSAQPAGATPYDGIIARADRKLTTQAIRLAVPGLISLVSKELSGIFPDSAAAGRMRAEHLLSRGLRRFAPLGVKIEAPRSRSRCTVAHERRIPPRTRRHSQRVSEAATTVNRQWYFVGCFAVDSVRLKALEAKVVHDGPWSSDEVPSTTTIWRQGRNGC